MPRSANTSLMVATALSVRGKPMNGARLVDWAPRRTASIVIRGHGFIQNLRRGHYESCVDAAPLLRLATAFAELRLAI